MKIGKATIDFAAHRIFGPAGDHSIEPMVMQVLSVLVEKADQVVTREELIDQVWGVGHGGDERLSRAIYLLRKALGEKRGRHNYIRTIPKQGYTLKLGVKGEAFGSDRSGLSKYKLGLKTPLMTLASIALMTVIGVLNFGKTGLFSSEIDPPLVVIMDSAHPARIYDEEIIAEGATNADILSDILADLEIRTQKELISPSWHRYESIKKFDPDLIVIHYSGFKQEDASGDRPQLRFLMEYFSNSDTKFLVYSRASQDWLQGNMDIILEEAYTQNALLKDRIYIFPLLEYGEPEWKNQASAQAMKLKVKDILALE